MTEKFQQSFKLMVSFRKKKTSEQFLFSPHEKNNHIHTSGKAVKIKEVINLSFVC